MKAIFLAGLLLAVMSSEAFAQQACNQFRANITTGAMGVTEKVAAVPNKRVYLCGYVIIRASGGQDLEFEISSGTGVNCATNKTPIIPRMDVPIAGIVNRIAVAAGEFTAPGHAVCLQTWGNGAVTSKFYWAQF